jgi:hypothetical protein
MRVISEGWIAILAFTIFLVSGFLVLYVTGAYDMKEIGSIIAGILWGTTIPILTWGFRYKLKFRGKIAKYLRFFDPLKGEPYYIDDGIRHYSSRDMLPSMNLLLSNNDLKKLEILSITHYLLILNYKNAIKDALERGVKITIWILDPEDTESINAQSKNYEGKKIREHIEFSMKELESLNNDNLIIQKYRKVIGKGIIIAHFDNPELSWIKIETYVNQGDANTRYSQACYSKDNQDFFDKGVRYFNEIKN